jgi:hypothetical protein
MPNNITLPKGIQAILDEVYRQASVTSVLTSPPSQLKPTQNVHEFCYPQMEVGGLGDYDRASGYTANSGVNLVWKTVTADYDRGTKIMVDEMDNQESFDLAFGQAANILMREHVAPEGDAFTFAKIAALTGITNNTDTIEGGAQFLEAILTATTEMDEDEVPEEQRYLFTTSTLLKSVKALDTTKSREALDGFAGIVKVPRGRFNTTIDLLSGRDGDEIAGGWKPSELSKPINFLIVHKPALIKFDRHVAGPTVIGPDMNPDADASIVKYRKYGVVDGYENKRAGIYLSHQ